VSQRTRSISSRESLETVILGLDQLLPGCSVPIILRRSGEEFTVVGESYNGVIYGEAVADLEAFYVG
jgi:hypothetical protein